MKLLIKLENKSWSWTFTREPSLKGKVLYSWPPHFLLLKSKKYIFIIKVWKWGPGWTVKIVNNRTHYALCRSAECRYTDCRGGAEKQLNFKVLVILNVSRRLFILPRSFQKQMRLFTIEDIRPTAETFQCQCSFPDWRYFGE
jgi:hypothetical protein